VSKSNEANIEDQGRVLNYHQEYFSVARGVQSVSLGEIISLTDVQFFHYNVRLLSVLSLILKDPKELVIAVLR